MNPILLSHVVADFLLQPKRMVELKQKSIWGIILHSAVHAAVLGLFLAAANWRTWLIVLLAAAVHGAIDQSKLIYAKKIKSFEAAFAIDQIAHFSFLTALAFAYAADYGDFWKTEIGLGIGMLLFIYSFGIAVFNTPKFNTDKSRLAVRYILVFATFAAFFTAARLTGG